MKEKLINRRNMLRGIGAMAIGGTLSVSAGVTAAERSSVSLSEARVVARAMATELATDEEFADWTAAGVRHPQLYHAKVQRDSTLQYVPRAWVFAVEDRKTDVGYIAVDATQRATPIIAFGRSAAPHKQTGRAAAIARSRGIGLNRRYLYHGGVVFGAETDDRRLIDLRSGRVRGMAAVDSVARLQPTTDKTLSSQGDKLNAPDWSGGTDDSILDVPNWTESDGGGASSTSYGSGDDTWQWWDGCTPIAASMCIGYHEGISKSQSNAKDALIDRLHDDMKTDNAGVTQWSNIDNGITNYAEGTNSYKGNNNHFNIKGNVNDAVAANEPPILNMVNGPYTKNDQLIDGHSVAVVGYRKGSDYYYHKVHNGYNTLPDRVSNGNWTDACITRIKIA